MRAPFTTLIVILLVASNLFAANVKITCSDQGLVNGQQLFVIHYPEKVPTRARDAIHLKGKSATFDNGTCSVDVNPGTYRFDVLFQKDSSIVALTTGKTQVTGSGASLKLAAQGEKKISMVLKGRPVPVKRCAFRVPGTMHIVEVEDSSPKAIMSPGKTFKVRLIGETGDVYVAVWKDVMGNKPTVDVNQDWHATCQFRWLGHTEKARDAKAYFFMPEERRNVGGNYEALYGGTTDDVLEIPMTPKTVFITNRKLVDMWYSYTTTSGEFVSFCRRPYQLSPNHLFEWGGEVRLVAHARVMMTWESGHRAIVWGANLLNDRGHMVNTPERAFGLPGDTLSTGGPAEIDWKQKLKRSDDKALTLGSPGKGERTDADFQLEEYIVEPQYPELFKSLKGANADVSDKFKIEVSYKLYGQQVNTMIPCSPWINYTIDHADFYAPEALNGLALSCLDRFERTWNYGTVFDDTKYQLARITVTWTGCRWQGYSILSKHSKVQLGMSTFRRRRSFYGSDWGPAHELMHSWGYSHGNRHNDVIKIVRDHYKNHHIFLADHPEYEMAAVTIDGKSLADYTKAKKAPMRSPGSSSRIPRPAPVPRRKPKSNAIAAIDKKLIAKLTVLTNEQTLPKRPLTLGRVKYTLKGSDENGTLTLGVGPASRQMKFSTLSLSDRAIIAAALSRTEPDNKGLYGVAAFYLECAGRMTLAKQYYQKAGTETKVKFDTLFQ